MQFPARFNQKSAMLLGCLLGALGLSVSGSCDWASAAPGLEVLLPQPIVAEAPSANRPPEVAAVAWFLPELSGNVEFERLVGDALQEAKKKRLDRRAVETRSSLKVVRSLIARRGLPEVLLGIPYMESRMYPGLVSPQCAGGPWQFLPEVAVDEGLRISSCTLSGSDELFTPGRKLPPRESRVYLDAGGCRIEHCEVDERRDFRRSTTAALRHLEGLLESPALEDHPDRVPLAILGFNTGIGGVEKLVNRLGEDAFSVVPSCANGDCLVLPHESGWYVPRVVASAAIVACNAADPSDPELSDWSRSELCRSLHEAGLAPAVSTASDVLMATAQSRKTSWRIGLTSTEVDGFGAESERHAVDLALARALGGIPGIEVVAGVPGESPEVLFEQGADVVVAGHMGRRGTSVWLRLERWSPGEELPSLGSFTLVRPSEITVEEASGALADALLRPVRDRQSDAIGSLVRARRFWLAECLPNVIEGKTEPMATLSLSVDGDGRPVALEVGPDALGDEPTACLEERLGALRFPRELSGAGAVLTFGLETPAVASSEE